MQERAHFQGQLTADEFRRAQFAAIPHVTLALPALPLLVTGATFVADGVRTLAASPLSTLARVVVALLFAILLYLYPRNAVKKVWSNTPIAHVPFSGDLSGEGLTWTSSVSQGSIAWSLLYGYRLRRGVLLIYTGPNQAFWLLPRLFDSLVTWERACELARAHLRSR